MTSIGSGSPCTSPLSPQRPILTATKQGQQLDDAAAIPLIIGITDFTWQAGDLTFTGIALRSIAKLVVYHGMRLLSRRNSAVTVS